MNNLEKILGYKFNDQSLLAQALVHSSYSSNLNENYERLEFLGDRVLGINIAYLLYKTFPNDVEGCLSQKHVALVNKDTVANIARNLGIAKYIKLANEEIRYNPNVLCDVCEAIIGAIYLDGGIDASLKFVTANWIEEIEKNPTAPKDAKTTLQELAHALGRDVPEYVIVKREGTEHEPVFYVEVTIKSQGSATGVGRSKKSAEQEAAAAMIRVINGN